MHACSLNYDDRVCSNFYDIWGDFMEATQNEQVFPTLTALKRLGASPDDREVTRIAPQLLLKELIMLIFTVACM